MLLFTTLTACLVDQNSFQPGPSGSFNSYLDENERRYYLKFYDSYLINFENRWPQRDRFLLIASIEREQCSSIANIEASASGIPLNDKEKKEQKKAK